MANDDYRRTIAADVGTSQPDLLRLSEDPTLAPIIARNTSAAPELLARLAHRDDVTRAAVAANPNTPRDVLLELAGEFPTQFLANPVLPLLLLEDPNLPMTMDEPTLAKIIRYEQAPGAFIRAAGARNGKELQAGRAMHVQVAGEAEPGWEQEIAPFILDVDFRYNTSDDLADMLRLPGLAPNWLLDLLVMQPSMYARVVRNPDTPAAHLERLAVYEDANVRRAIIAHPHVPAELIQRLARDPTPRVRQAVAGSNQVDAELLDLLAGDRDLIVRRAVAKNPLATAAILDRLANDPEPDLRRVVARNSATSPTTLAHLAKEADKFVRQFVAANPQTSLAVLIQLASDSTAKVRAAVALNPHLPLEHLHHLAQNTEQGVLVAVAKSPNTPEILLRQFVETPISEVRTAVAANPNTPVAVLQRLANAKDRSVRMGVAKNPGAPVDILEHLAQAREQMIRRVVAENSNTPSPVLDRLAQADKSTRVAVASNPNTSTATLTLLANDPEHEVRLAVSQNPHTPHAALALLANAGMEIRRAVAAHPNANASLFEKLLPRADFTILSTIIARGIRSDADLQHTYARFLPMYLAMPGRSLVSRVVALAAPAMPAEVLRRYAATDHHWLECFVVAQNTSTPWDVLETLTRDGNRFVRAAARRSLEQMSIADAKSETR